MFRFISGFFKVVMAAFGSAELTEANLEAWVFRLEFAKETLQSFKEKRDRSRMNLLELPSDIMERIFKFAGGEEHRVSQTCHSCYAYVAPTVKACEVAIDQVLHADQAFARDTDATLEAAYKEALDKLESHSAFSAARTVLCNHGRVTFADCYWFYEVECARDGTNM